MGWSLGDPMRIELTANAFNKALAPGPFPLTVIPAVKTSIIGWFRRRRNE